MTHAGQRKRLEVYFQWLVQPLPFNWLTKEDIRLNALTTIAFCNLGFQAHSGVALDKTIT